MDTVKERIEKEAKEYKDLQFIDYGDLSPQAEIQVMKAYIAGATAERNKAIEFVIKCINKHQKLPDTDTSGFYALENLKEELTAHREHLNH